MRLFCKACLSITTIDHEPMAGQRITTRKLNVFTLVAQPRFSKNVLVGRRWKFNVEDALHKKCDFGRSLLCGPLCISAFSAFNRYFLRRARKRYTEGAEKTNQICDFSCKSMLKIAIAKKLRTASTNAIPAKISPVVKSMFTFLQTPFRVSVFL